MKEFFRKPAIPFALLRVLIFLVAMFFIIVVVEGFGLYLFEDAFPDIDQRSPLFFTLTRGATTLFTLLLVWFLRKNIDRRPSFKRWFASTNRKFDILTGFLFGAFLIGVATLFLTQLGFMSLTAGNLTANTAVQYVIMFFVGALFEEVAFRGYIQDNLMEDFHPAIALIVTSVLFMFLHMSNPSIDSIPVLNLFLAGLLLGASYIYTKNLWFPLGLHWAWNLFQGPVFGFEVSGINTDSLFQQTIFEQSIWTGGDFGFEGSILATIMISIATLLTLYYFKKNQIHESN